MADAGQAGSLGGRLLRLPDVRRGAAPAAGFLETRPAVSLHLERAAKNVQADAIRDGRMHLGFSRRYPSEPGLCVRHVAGEPLYLALPEAHPLLEAGEAELRTCGEQLVLFPAAPAPASPTRSASCVPKPGSRHTLPRGGGCGHCPGVRGDERLLRGSPRSATGIALPGVVCAAGRRVPPVTELSVSRGQCASLVEAFLDYVSASRSLEAG
ncbi:hypothetical protein E4K10_44785 [Streptomyces sp. T1317-0309]|nr:hypothetical protein E4K10_44785 [Streptomyces sp. T1317-0309]